MMKAIYTHYDNLGVSRNAPDDVIKAAYRILSKKYHPDLNPGNPHAANRMKSINESYRILCDANRRKLYDEWISEQEIHTRETEPENQTYKAQKNITRQNSQSIRKNSSNQKIAKNIYHNQIKFVITAGIIIFAALPVFLIFEPIQQNILDYNKSQKKPLETTASYSDSVLQITIDPYTAIIPKNFSGDDISVLYKEEVKSFPQKDEFEKLDEYKNRFKSTQYHKPYFFISRFANVSAYDIDKQIISINLIDENETSLEKPFFIDTKKFYSNAENLNNIIPETTNYFLKDIRQNAEIAEYLRADIRFRIEPGNGRELKNHLGLLIIATPETDNNGRIVSENLSNEYGPFYQVNKKISNRYIHSKIKSIWIFNMATGVVYYKKNIPETPDEEYMLGLSFETGKEQIKNIASAFKWYTIAAKHQNVKAQFKLRKMYAKGAENHDHISKAQWYQTASSNRTDNKAIPQTVNSELFINSSEP